jgi:putative spermidine/putrescine transport system ATP-binding protein/spermidine/putrescine transport system ATP-binding protein
LAVRAEKVFLSENAPAEDPETVVLDGKVTAVDYQGQAARYFVEAGPLKLQAINPIDRHPFHEGQPVKLRIRAQDVVLLDAEAHAGTAAKAAAE